MVTPPWTRMLDIRLHRCHRSGMDMVVINDLIHALAILALTATLAAALLKEQQ